MCAAQYDVERFKLVDHVVRLLSTTGHASLLSGISTGMSSYGVGSNVASGASGGGGGSSSNAGAGGPGGVGSLGHVGGGGAASSGGAANSAVGGVSHDVLSASNVSPALGSGPGLGLALSGLDAGGVGLGSHAAGSGGGSTGGGSALGGLHDDADLLQGADDLPPSHLAPVAPGGLSAAAVPVHVLQGDGSKGKIVAKRKMVIVNKGKDGTVTPARSWALGHTAERA